MSFAETMPAHGHQEGLQYWWTLSYIFDNRNWGLNLLWLFLCWLVAQILPIVPQIVSTGYQVEVLNGLLASQGARYPDFDLNRILDYLVRGLWAVMAGALVFIIWFFLFAAYVTCAVLGLVALANYGGEDWVGLGVGV